MRLIRNSAFTLLEVIISVTLTALVALSIFPFVRLNLDAIGQSEQQSRREASMQALIAVLQQQMNDLPLAKQGALAGDAHRISDISSDELHWLTRPGNSLFTEKAAGEYRVTLALRRPSPRENFDLGLRRVPVDRPGNEINWLPLIKNISELEIRYFDPRLNAWLEKWTDPQTRPALIRIRILRGDGELPYEAIIGLPKIGQAIT
jgi:type II secretory pathway pseudopilin PulG